MSEHKNSCGFNHLTSEQKQLLESDAAAIFAQVFQDYHHGLLPNEIAFEMGKLAFTHGLTMSEILVENALKINQLSANIVIKGFAGDVPN